MGIENKIKELRKKFGLTQESLAEKLCVSRQAIAKWESGNGVPDTDNLKALSKLFEISIDTLLDNESEIPLTILHQEIKRADFGKNILEQNINIINKNYDDSWSIYGLYWNNKLFSAEAVAEALTFSISELPNDINRVNDTYFLALKENYKQIIKISKNSIDIKALKSNINIKKFNIKNRTYYNLGLVKR